MSSSEVMLPLHFSLRTIRSSEASGERALLPSLELGSVESKWRGHATP
jgi:hypothetical protein